MLAHNNAQPPRTKSQKTPARTVTCRPTVTEHKASRFKLNHTSLHSYMREYAGVAYLTIFCLGRESLVCSAGNHRVALPSVTYHMYMVGQSSCRRCRSRSETGTDVPQSCIASPC